ncbi:MAG: 3-isopropylmalate dehydratase small subunit [Sphingomonas sp.]
MEKFDTLAAVALPIDRPNCDTDQIVPARFLQKPRSADFGAFLFRDLRADPDFALNRPAFADARILVARRNFGCGSSREHAVWALWDHGFRAVIAPSLGDIFAANATRNGLLTIVLPEPAIDAIFAEIAARQESIIRIDLPAQTVTWGEAPAERFDIDPYAKHCLTSGLDELGYTLECMDAIQRFETTYTLEKGEA